MLLTKAVGINYSLLKKCPRFWFDEMTVNRLRPLHLSAGSVVHSSGATCSGCLRLEGLFQTALFSSFHRCLIGFRSELLKDHMRILYWTVFDSPDFLSGSFQISFIPWQSCVKQRQETFLSLKAPSSSEHAAGVTCQKAPVESHQSQRHFLSDLSQLENSSLAFLFFCQKGPPRAFSGTHKRLIRKLTTLIFDWIIISSF